MEINEIKINEIKEYLLEILNIIKSKKYITLNQLKYDIDEFKNILNEKNVYTKKSFNLNNAFKDILSKLRDQFIPTEGAINMATRTIKSALEPVYKTIKKPFNNITASMDKKREIKLLKALYRFNDETKLLKDLINRDGSLTNKSFMYNPNDTNIIGDINEEKKAKKKALREDIEQIAKKIKAAKKIQSFIKKKTAAEKAAKIEAEKAAEKAAEKIEAEKIEAAKKNGSKKRRINNMKNN